MRSRLVARIAWVLVPAVAFVVVGCSTTKGFLGLATTGYVDQQMSAAVEQNKKTVDQIESELQTLQGDVGKVKDQSDQINAILDELAQTKSSTEQLQKLATGVQDKLDALPRETLMQLADLIQKALAQTAPATGQGQ